MLGQAVGGAAGGIGNLLGSVGQAFQGIFGKAKQGPPPFVGFPARPMPFSPITINVNIQNNPLGGLGGQGGIGGQLGQIASQFGQLAQKLGDLLGQVAGQFATAGAGAGGGTTGGAGGVGGGDSSGGGGGGTVGDSKSYGGNLDAMMADATSSCSLTR